MKSKDIKCKRCDEKVKEYKKGDDLRWWYKCTKCDFIFTVAKPLNNKLGIVSLTK